VYTITQAIVLMGFRAVRNTAISMAIYGMVNKLAKSSSFDVTAFWTRSVASGVIAKYLAGRINQPDMIEAAFIAGFMHDIGQVVLAGVFPSEYEQISREETESPDVYLQERSLMGVDHMQAGGVLARKWNLPKALEMAITDHHRLGHPPEERSEHLLIDLVYLSDRLCAHVMRGTAPDSQAYQKMIEQARPLIDISETAMVELLSVCRQHMAEIASDLEIDIESEFSRHSVPSVDLTDMHARLSHKEIQLAFLQNASNALMDLETEEEILQVAAETIFRGLGMGRTIVFALNESKDAFQGRVGFGFESQKAVKALSFPLDDPLFKQMQEAAQPLSVLEKDENLYGAVATAPSVNALEANAFVAVPLRMTREVPYVVFADYPKRERPFNDDTVRSVNALCNQAALCLERLILRGRLPR
jgi:HD-like signal output (HDOD) protein